VTQAAFASWGRGIFSVILAQYPKLDSFAMSFEIQVT
jgi:hypothetical protein